MPVGIGLAGGRVGLGLATGAGAAAPAWWYVAGVTCVAAYQPKGAASLAASYVNLANPGTYNAAPGVAPTFDAARGWIFAGAGQLNTNAPIPNTNGSMILRWANGSGTVSQWFCGNRSGGSNGMVLWYRISSGAGNIAYDYGGRVVIAGVPPTAGVMAIAGGSTYLDGVSNGLILGSYTGSVNMIIGNSSYPLFADVIAVALYSGVLSGPQVATLSAAMAAL